MSDPLGILAQAEAYIARGWSVIPLVPGAKRPLLPLAPFLSGEERATSGVLWEWWGPQGYHQDAGIGIVCGTPSGGLVVIDVDPRNGGDIASVTRDVETDCVVATAGGGVHLYTISAGTVPKGKTERPGVDRQGEGSFVVAPPTVIGGNEYTWLRDGQPGLTPPWVYRSPAPLPRLDNEGAGARWIAATLAAPETIAPGFQDETLTRLAWWAAGNMPEDIAMSILVQWCKRLPLGRPNEPWLPEHVGARLESAYAKRSAEFVVQSAAACTVTQPRLLTTADEAQIAAIAAMVRSAPDYTVIERDDWIVEHLVAPGAWTELTGEVKKGKTTFNCQMIEAVLEGKPFLGWKTEKTAVVLYTEQVGLSLVKTLERAGIRSHPNLYLLTQADVFGKPWRAVVAALIRRCQAVGAKLLFTDTLTRLAGVEGESENTSGIVSILDPFTAAKAAGVGCVFVRHASKSRENREDVSRAGRGSTAITGDMDIACLLYQPGSEDIRKVRCTSRLGEVAEKTLRYRDGTYEEVSDVDVPTTSVDKVRAENRAKVQAALDAGHKTQVAIADATGLDRSTVRKYLAQITGGMEVTFDDE